LLVAELGAQVGTELACALAVPEQFGVDLAALGLHVEAHVLDARAHACAADLARACAAGACGGGAGGLDDGGAGAIVHRQPQIACGALDREIGLEILAQGVQVPARVEAQVAGNPGGFQWRIVIAQAEGIDPGQRNSKRLPCAAHTPLAAAGTGDGARIPCQLGGCSGSLLVRLRPNFGGVICSLPALN
jgi:hypothetical protein